MTLGDPVDMTDTVSHSLRRWSSMQGERRSSPAAHAAQWRFDGAVQPAGAGREQSVDAHAKRETPDELLPTLSPLHVRVYPLPCVDAAQTCLCSATASRLHRRVVHAHAHAHAHVLTFALAVCPMCSAVTPPLVVP